MKKIKLWHKNSVIEKIMRDLGSFEKDNKQKNLFDGMPRATLRIIVVQLQRLRNAA